MLEACIAIFDCDILNGMKVMPSKDFGELYGRLAIASLPQMKPARGRVPEMAMARKRRQVSR
jgi:hypothetical protein